MDIFPRLSIDTFFHLDGVSKYIIIQESVKFLKGIFSNITTILSSQVFVAVSVLSIPAIEHMD